MTNKLDKAINLGLEIIDEEELLRRIGTPQFTLPLTSESAEAILSNTTMQIKSQTSPVGAIHLGTLFETWPFNFTFDGEFEAFSFYVPDAAIATATKLVKDKAAFVGWACTFVGRRMDIPRCESAGLRVVDQAGQEPEVEIRLKFQVPWYYTEAQLAAFGDGCNSVVAAVKEQFR